MAYKLLWVKAWLSDMKLVLDLLDDSGIAAFVRACYTYITNGALPDNLPKDVAACFNQARPHIDDSIADLKRTSDRQRENRQSGWNKQKGSTMVYQGIPSNTTVNGGISRVEVESKKEIEAEAEKKKNTVSAPASAADLLISVYNLPRDSVTREALEEDLQKHGETRMREVLKEACQSNDRERVSVKYWRAILNGKGKTAKIADSDYLRRNYSEEDFSNMVINLDSSDENGLHLQ